MSTPGGFREVHHFAFFHGHNSYCLHFSRDPWKCCSFTEFTKCPEGQEQFIEQVERGYPEVVVAEAEEIIGCIESDR